MNEADLLWGEAEQVHERRRLLGIADAGGPDPARPAGADAAAARKCLADQQSVGLAFSGGGIRSATFNLGLLQGLAQLKLLRYVDFLSTVSGGGYIGAWFTSWIQREQSLSAVERKLQPAPVGRHQGPAATEEPHEIHHLRRYSNYLAPRAGFLTADTWVLYATYLRNFLLCQAVLLPTITLVLLFARFALMVHHPDLLRGDRLGHAGTWENFLGVVVVVLWLCAGAVAVTGAFQVREEGEADGAAPWWTTLLFLCVLLPLVGSAVFFCYFPASQLQRLHAAWPLYYFPVVDELLAKWAGWSIDEARLLLAYVAAPAVVLFMVAVLVYVPMAFVAALRARRWSVVLTGLWTGVRHCWWMTLAGCLGGLLLFAIFQLLTAFYATQGFMEVHSAMAEDDKTRRLAAELYPELGVAAPVAEPAADVSREFVELHNLLRMLQVLENAWLSLNLDAEYAHPLNRGWMDAFYRWTSTPTFRKLWPVLRSEYGRGFVRFCERQAGIGVVNVEISPLPNAGALPPRFCTEFSDEWLQDAEPLATRFGRCVTFSGAPLCWLVQTRMPNQTQRADCGIVMICQDPSGEPDVLELFIWLRGPYRNTGIGRPALHRAIDELCRRWVQEFTFICPPLYLTVRLPKSRLTGVGGKMLESMWLTFFHHEDFRRIDAPAVSEPAAPVSLVQQARKARAECIILQRKIHP